MRKFFKKKLNLFKEQPVYFEKKNKYKSFFDLAFRDKYADISVVLEQLYYCFCNTSVLFF